MMLGKMPCTEIRLRKSGGGVFEITVDGKLAYLKKASGRFPRHHRLMNRADPLIQKGERVACRVAAATDDAFA